MDRFLSQDDARGVEEPLREVRTTKTVVRLQLESEGYCKTCVASDKPVHPSRLANRINADLNWPTLVLSSVISVNDSKPAQKELSALVEPLPCDWHLLMLKPVRHESTSPDIGMMLHRVGTDCAASVNLDYCRDASSAVKLSRFLKLQRPLTSYNVTTLNFIHVLSTEKADRGITVEPSKIKGLVFRA